MQPVAFSDPGLLKGEPVTIDRGAESRRQTLDQLETRESRRLVEQVLVGQLAQPVVLPPRRLLLATVPVEHVGEQPQRLLLLGPFLLLLRHSLE